MVARAAGEVEAEEGKRLVNVVRLRRRGRCFEGRKEAREEDKRLVYRSVTGQVPQVPQVWRENSRARENPWRGRTPGEREALAREMLRGHPSGAPQVV